MDYKAKTIELYNIRKALAESMSVKEYKGNRLYECNGQKSIDNINLYFSLMTYPTLLKERITITIP